MSSRPTCFDGAVHREAERGAGGGAAAAEGSMMASTELCGYGCGAEATVDFFWPNDAEVWHVCDKHAQALQKMLDEHEGADWASQVVRAPRGRREFEPRRGDDGAGAMADECSVSAMGKLGDHLWPLLWRIRNWLTRDR